MSTPATRLRAFSHRRKTLSRADRQLAGWMLASLATLLPVVWLMLSGRLVPLGDAQVRLLASHPFHMTAEEAQVSFLTPVGTFFVCLLLTLWLAAVLLREHRFTLRCQVCFLAAVATAIPGLLCVLWGGVLEVAAPLLCIAVLWVLMVPVAACGRLLNGLMRLHRLNQLRRQRG